MFTHGFNKMRSSANIFLFQQGLTSMSQIQSFLETKENINLSNEDGTDSKLLIKEYYS